MTLNLRRRGLLATLPLVAAAPAALAQSLQLPPIVDPASGEHHVGKVILVELVTPDLAGTKRFYAGVFGWTFRDIAAGRTPYAEASIDGRAVAGLVEKAFPAGERRQPAWLGFFAVGDVDRAKDVALRHGARLLFGPRSFPGRGREAVLADPQGATFGILASTSGDPPDFLPAPGEWIWSSLITVDPDTDAAFYQALFGYQVFPLEASGSGAQHLLFTSRNYARASANSLPAGEPNAHPYWLNYVRVEDVAGTAEKAVALGGRVLVDPRSDRHGGRVAVIADPLGAPVGLLEWPETRSKEVAK